MAESKEELKSLLMKMKADSEKAGFKQSKNKDLFAKKIKIYLIFTSWQIDGPITSWQIDGETMETVTDFIFLGSKITVVGNFSHEIKRC